MDDFLKAFRSLCDREGGFKPVAERAQVGEQHLYQVYAGIKLPSGNARGLGPSTRKKITKSFPDWLKQDLQNIQSVTTRGRVPLISWVAAGKLGEIVDMYQPGEAEQWIDAYEAQPGESAFALRVDGDSMTSPYPGEDTFPNGSIIIVDPSRACDAGDYVVAKDVSTQEATFKKLVRDGGRWFLKPLNTSYPTIEIDDPSLRVIGKVVESMTRKKY